MISADEWDAVAFDTKDRMGDYVYPFTTPISRATSYSEGESLGTGNYVRIDHEPHLLTNEHVAWHAKKATLAHLPVAGDNFVRVTEQFITWTWPVDIGITKLVDPISRSKDKVLSLADFDPMFSPVEGEVLFWLGYPGTTAKRTDVVNARHIRYSRWGELSVRAIPVLTRRSDAVPVEKPGEYHAGVHVVVDYPVVGVPRLGEEPEEAPEPSGMSGSLLWDTKRVACADLQVEWTPERARVCGILWAALREPDVVLVTPVQFIHDCVADLRV